MERYVYGDKVTEDKTSIQSQYNKLELNRETYLERARDCAELTIPTLFPPKSSNAATEYKSPYQSIGARGVMNLASKLMLALLPPQTSFFKLQLDESQLGQEMGPEIKSELDLSFAKVERIILESIAATDDRVAVHQALLHLVVAVEELGEGRPPVHGVQLAQVLIREVLGKSLVIAPALVPP